MSFQSRLTEIIMFFALCAIFYLCPAAIICPRASVDQYHDNYEEGRIYSLTWVIRRANATMEIYTVTSVLTFPSLSTPRPVKVEPSKSMINWMCNFSSKQSFAIRDVGQEKKNTDQKRESRWFATYYLHITIYNIWTWGKLPLQLPDIQGGGGVLWHTERPLRVLCTSKGNIVSKPAQVNQGNEKW